MTDEERKAAYATGEDMGWGSRYRNQSFLLAVGIRGGQTIVSVGTPFLRAEVAGLGDHPDDLGSFSPKLPQEAGLYLWEGEVQYETFGELGGAPTEVDVTYSGVARRLDEGLMTQAADEKKIQPLPEGTYSGQVLQKFLSKIVTNLRTPPGYFWLGYPGQGMALSKLKEDMEEGPLVVEVARCTCRFPETVYRNVTGHAGDCPAYPVLQAVYGKARQR